MLRDFCKFHFVGAHEANCVLADFLRCESIRAVPTSWATHLAPSCSPLRLACRRESTWHTQVSLLTFEMFSTLSLREKYILFTCDACVVTPSKARNGNFSICLVWCSNTSSSLAFNARSSSGNDSDFGAELFYGRQLTQLTRCCVV